MPLPPGSRVSEVGRVPPPTSGVRGTGYAQGSVGGGRRTWYRREHCCRWRGRYRSRRSWFTTPVTTGPGPTGLLTPRNTTGGYTNGRSVDGRDPESRGSTFTPRGSGALPGRCRGGRLPNRSRGEGPSGKCRGCTSRMASSGWGSTTTCSIPTGTQNGVGTDRTTHWNRVPNGGDPVKCHRWSGRQGKRYHLAVESWTASVGSVSLVQVLNLQDGFRTQCLTPG